MNNIKPLYIAACAVFLSFASQAQDNATAKSAQDNTTTSNTTAHNNDNTADNNTTARSVNPDNTKVNTRDRNTNERTADQAKNNLPDRKVMQKIRQAIIADKSLSTYAHNIKIIAENGKVTLKGPVRSEAERKRIEDKATQVAGAGNVTNEISVKGNSRRS